MGRSAWPERKASVILLPSGAQGEAILQLAGEWTRMGLLGPALWVRPEQVRRARSGPPRIGASILVLDRDHRLGEIQVDLFESLARESLALVRLVKLRSAVPSREIDAEQDEIAEQVGEYLAKAMPMAVPTVSVADQATSLSRLTLICAPTEFQLQTRVDWAASEYGTVVIASPEDRATPWSGDAFVRDNDRFVGFALMHLASIAGLWSGTGVGTFELVPREASNQQSVWVSRVFLNAVITEALGRRTASQVLELASRADSLLIDPSTGSPPIGTAFIDESMVGPYLKQMVTASMALDHGALSFHPSEEEATLGRGRFGIFEQLGRFFAFSADKLLAMPGASWRWLTSRAARTLTTQLQSDDGTHVVGQDYDAVLDARDSLLIVRRDQIFDAEQKAREAMSAPVGISTLRTTPRLWARLRELVFGSLDGSSDLGELGFEAIEEKVPVFGRVSDVFPDPDETWSIEQGPANLPMPIDWFVLAESEPRLHLAAWANTGSALAQQSANEAAAAEHAFQLLPEPVAARSRVQTQQSDAGAPVEQVQDPAPARSDAGHELDLATGSEGAEPESSATDERDEAGQEASAAGEDSADDELLPEPEPEPEPEPLPEPEPTDARARMQREMRAEWERARHRRDTAREHHERADAERIRRDEALASYDAWAGTRDRSFAWRLLAQLGADRTAARTAVTRYANEIERLRAPVAGELIRLRKAFHRRMLVAWLVLIVVAAIVELVPLLVDTLREDFAGVGLWYPQTWQTVLIAIGIGAVLTTGFLAAYHRGWSTFQRHVDVTHAHLEHVSEASRNARRELARLASLHRQTVEWLDLLARAIHHPWQVRPEWALKPDYEVARESLPFAMTVGTVVESDYAAATRLRRMTTEHLVRRGWRADAFRDLVREVGAELGQDGESFGVGALDEDLPHSSNNARRMLRDAMGQESVLTRVAAPRLRALMAEIQRTALHGSKPRVESIDDNPLDALAAMSDPVGGDDGIAWDDFLVDSLAGRREPVTPLSASWLAQRQVQEGHHEHVTSYLVMPDRLVKQLEFHPDAAVVISPFQGSGRSGIDLVWRADVAGPLPIAAIGLWDAPRTPVAIEVDPETYDSGV